VRHGGIAICAVVSPYEATRNEVKQQIGPDSFVLVYVATPLAECERRDSKGLYAKARRGEITGMTGIDDPYEPPSSPDMVLQTMECDAQRCADCIEHFLEDNGFL
jgi:sulfate adenylyltransferase